jgi:hypothetical protein
MLSNKYMSRFSFNIPAIAAPACLALLLGIMPASAQETASGYFTFSLRKGDGSTQWDSTRKFSASIPSPSWKMDPGNKYAEYLDMQPSIYIKDALTIPVQYGGARWFTKNDYLLSFDIKGQSAGDTRVLMLKSEKYSRVEMTIGQPQNTRKLVFACMKGIYPTQGPGESEYFGLLSNRDLPQGQWTRVQVQKITGIQYNPITRGYSGSDLYRMWFTESDGKDYLVAQYENRLSNWPTVGELVYCNFNEKNPSLSGSVPMDNFLLIWNPPGSTPRPAANVSAQSVAPQYLIQEMVNQAKAARP